MAISSILTEVITSVWAYTRGSGEERFTPRGIANEIEDALGVGSLRQELMHFAIVQISCDELDEVVLTRYSTNFGSVYRKNSRDGRLEVVVDSESRPFN